jgi:hypothetical protein
MLAQAVDIEKTVLQYKEVTDYAKTVVLSKNDKYGQSWLVSRPFSMLEQVWIKIHRIRTIQEKSGEQKIQDEPIHDDFYHIINYCIFGLILMEQPGWVLSLVKLKKHYDNVIKEALTLCRKKNHDYGEAWRILNISSMIDLMLMKFYRAKTMYSNRSLQSKDLDEIFKDILNYAIFCRIRINEGTDPLL